MKSRILALFLCLIPFQASSMNKANIKVFASVDYIAKLIVFSRAPKFGEDVPADKSLKKLLKAIGKKKITSISGNLINSLIKTIKNNMLEGLDNNNEDQANQISWITGIAAGLKLFCTVSLGFESDKSLINSLIEFLELDKCDRIVDVETISLLLKSEKKIHEKLFNSGSDSTVITTKPKKSTTPKFSKNNTSSNNSSFKNSFSPNVCKMNGGAISLEKKIMIKSVFGDDCDNETAKMLVKYHLIHCKENNVSLGFKEFLKTVNNGAALFGLSVNEYLVEIYDNKQ